MSSAVVQWADYHVLAIRPAAAPLSAGTPPLGSSPWQPRSNEGEEHRHDGPSDPHPCCFPPAPPLLSSSIAPHHAAMRLVVLDAADICRRSATTAAASPTIAAPAGAAVSTVAGGGSSSSLAVVVVSSSGAPPVRGDGSARDDHRAVPAVAAAAPFPTNGPAIALLTTHELLPTLESGTSAFGGGCGAVRGDDPQGLNPTPPDGKLGGDDMLLSATCPLGELLRLTAAADRRADGRRGDGDEPAPQVGGLFQLPPSQERPFLLGCATHCPWRPSLASKDVASPTDPLPLSHQHQGEAVSAAHSGGATKLGIVPSARVVAPAPASVIHVCHVGDHLICVLFSDGWAELRAINATVGAHHGSRAAMAVLGRVDCAAGVRFSADEGRIQVDGGVAIRRCGGGELATAQAAVPILGNEEEGQTSTTGADLARRSPPLHVAAKPADTEAEAAVESDPPRLEAASSQSPTPKAPQPHSIKSDDASCPTARSKSGAEESHRWTPHNAFAVASPATASSSSSEWHLPHGHHHAATASSAAATSTSSSKTYIIVVGALVPQSEAAARGGGGGGSVERVAASPPSSSPDQGGPDYDLSSSLLSSPPVILQLLVTHWTVHIDDHAADSWFSDATRPLAAGSSAAGLPRSRSSSKASASLHNSAHYFMEEGGGHNSNGSPPSGGGIATAAPAPSSQGPAVSPPVWGAVTWNASVLTLSASSPSVRLARSQLDVAFEHAAAESRSVAVSSLSAKFAAAAAAPVGDIHGSPRAECDGSGLTVLHLSFGLSGTRAAVLNKKNGGTSASSPSSSAPNDDVASQRSITSAASRQLPPHQGAGTSPPESLIGGGGPFHYVAVLWSPSSTVGAKGQLSFSSTPHNHHDDSWRGSSAGAKWTSLALPLAQPALPAALRRSRANNHLGGQRPPQPSTGATTTTPSSREEVPHPQFLRPSVAGIVPLPARIGSSAGWTPSTTSASSSPTTGRKDRGNQQPQQTPTDGLSLRVGDEGGELPPFDVALVWTPTVAVPSQPPSPQHNAALDALVLQLSANVFAVEMLTVALRIDHDHAMSVPAAPAAVGMRGGREGGGGAAAAGHQNSVRRSGLWWSVDARQAEEYAGRFFRAVSSSSSGGAEEVLAHHRPARNGGVVAAAPGGILAHAPDFTPTTTGNGLASDLQTPITITAEPRGATTSTFPDVATTGGPSFASSTGSAGGRLAGLSTWPGEHSTHAPNHHLIPPPLRLTDVRVTTWTESPPHPYRNSNSAAMGHRNNSSSVTTATAILCISTAPLLSSVWQRRCHSLAANPTVTGLPGGSSLLPPTAARCIFLFRRRGDAPHIEATTAANSSVTMGAATGRENNPWRAAATPVSFDIFGARGIAGLSSAAFSPSAAAAAGAGAAAPMCVAVVQAPSPPVTLPGAAPPRSLPPVGIVAGIRCYVTPLDNAVVGAPANHNTTSASPLAGVQPRGDGANRDADADGAPKQWLAKIKRGFQDLINPRRAAPAPRPPGEGAAPAELKEVAPRNADHRVTASAAGDAVFMVTGHHLATDRIMGIIFRQGWCPAPVATPPRKRPTPPIVCAETLAAVGSGSGGKQHLHQQPPVPAAIALSQYEWTLSWSESGDAFLCVRHRPWIASSDHPAAFNAPGSVSRHGKR